MAVAAPPDAVPKGEPGHVRRVLITVLVVACVAALFWVFRVAGRGVLTVGAGALGAVVLDALVRVVRRVLPVPRLAAFAILMVVLAGLGVGLSLWFGAAAIEQLDGLEQRIVQAWPRVQARLAESAWGRQALEELGRISPMEHVAGPLRDATVAALGGVGVALLVVVFAVYFAAAPGLYIESALHLVPLKRRARSRAVIEETGRALRSWLVARAISMAVVGVGTGVGLWIAGVPMPVVLGILAGLLSFVPNIGPLVAGVPGVLVALSESPTTALWAVAVYVGVQAIDNYVVTPLVNLRAVDVPPAVELGTQLVLGLIAGALGLLLATPLLIVVIVAVQMLYVQDVLGDPVPVLGERHRRRRG